MIFYDLQNLQIDWFWNDIYDKSICDKNAWTTSICIGIFHHICHTQTCNDDDVDLEDWESLLYGHKIRI